MGQFKCVSYVVALLALTSHVRADELDRAKRLAVPDADELNATPCLTR